MATVNNNTPTLRFPEFKGNWELKKLGEITEKVNSGKTPLGGESVYVEKGILFIRSQNVLDSKLSFENSTFITEKINNTMKNSVVKANDILLNITGASLGRSCVVPNNFTVGNVNQHVCIIRLNKENEPYFIQPIFSSEKGQNIFTSLQTGSGREGLNFQSIRGMTLPFPTLPEQQKIATFLTTVDEKLQALKQKKSLLEQYKKGVMQQIFSQELRFKDDNGNEFADWEVKKLRELDIYVSDGNYGELYPRADQMVSSGVPFIRANNIKNLKLTMNDMKFIDAEHHKILKSGHLKTGDILVTTRGEIGMLAYVSEEFNNSNINAQICLLRVDINLSSRFLLNYLSSSWGISQFKALQTGSALKQLPRASLAKIVINLPCLEEQTKIANFLTAIDEKINQCQAQITNAEAWKKGLLQQLFV